mgnify:CR=1 FL=1
MDGGQTKALHKPLGLLAELTHRCPLGCPYCSNPLALEKREDELDTATWMRVFKEAAALGVLHVHLSGGEPGARETAALDRREMLAHAVDLGNPRACAQQRLGQRLLCGEADTVHRRGP